MPMETLQDLLLDNLKDLYSAEKQLLVALPKLARRATTPTLKEAIETHRDETEEHVARLEQAFQMLGTAARGETCKAMEGLIEEGKEMMEENGDDAVRDAGIIGAAQKVEHYEIAADGTVVAYARRLGNEEMAELLETTLDEEKSADEKLNNIAEGEVNAMASAGAMPDSEGDIEEAEEDEPRPTGRRSPAKRKR
jgi:ferritin-like metal-binding protein YciE